jgi:4'-phosphopantetheinyl transferase
MHDMLILDQGESTHFLPPLKGEVHLYTIPLHCSRDQAERLRAVLSPEENKKASFYKPELIQNRFIVTQAVLRMLLAEFLGIQPAEVRLAVHKKGKPYFLNDPSIFFNASNSYDTCVYAFTRGAEVGVDIEKIRELPDIDLLIDKNLTPGEKKFVMRKPGSRLARFIQFWTFKEAFLKGIGEGMRLTPENLEFYLDDGTIRLRLVNYGFDTAEWQFKGFTRKGRITGTVAYSGKETVIREMNIALG